MPTDIDYAVIAEVMIASNEAETAIIDTGCAKAVGGSKWIASYIKTLDPDDKKHARSIQSKAKFKFGDGKVYKSKCKHICPIYLGGRRKFIIFDEVNCDIPLLISLELVKKMDLRIRFKHDTAKLPGGPKFRLNVSKGHYWASIGKQSSLRDVIGIDQHLDNDESNAESNEEDDDNEEMETLISVSNIQRVLVANVFDQGKVEQQIFKLHIQMAHPPLERFIKRLKTGRAWKEKMMQMVEKLYQNCESKKCRARKETKFVRKTAFRHAERLGQLVAMDLKIRSRGGKGHDILY